MERILCIMGKLDPGGVKSMILSYYSFLDKSRYQYDFVCDNDSKTSIPEDIIQMGARSFSVPPVTKPIKNFRALRKIIKNGNYKIIHSNINTLSVFPLFAALTCGVKYRILHNHSTTSPLEKKRHFFKIILRPFGKLLSNKWCACSDLAGRWMYGDKAFDSGKVTVLKNAIDIEKFLYDPESAISVRKEFNIENKTVIGHIGRFLTQKNHFFLIDIFNEYKKLNENSVLLLCGEGPLLEEVKEYAEKLSLQDSVIFAGVRNDISRIYSAFDVFLLPSLYEGLPVVAMEAIASGLPVYLSDKITEECKINDNVFFLPINDASLWAESIRISSCDRAENSAQMKNGDYDMTVAVKKLEKLYDSLT